MSSPAGMDPPTLHLKGMALSLFFIKKFLTLQVSNCFSNQLIEPNVLLSDCPYLF